VIKRKKISGKLKAEMQLTFFDDELMNFIRENIYEFGKKAVQLSDSEIVVSSSSEPSFRGIS
jgi:hypothetical protein